MLTSCLAQSNQLAVRDVFVWDGALANFGVRIKPSGVRAYFVQYRNRHGRSKRLTIGRHGNSLSNRRGTALESRLSRPTGAMIPSLSEMRPVRHQR